MIRLRSPLLRHAAVPLVVAVGFAALAVASVRAGGEAVTENATAESLAAPLIAPPPSRRMAAADLGGETARPVGVAPHATPAKPLAFPPASLAGTRPAAAPATRMVADARAARTVAAPAPAPAPATPAPSAGDGLVGVGAKLMLGSLILVGALWALSRFVRRLPIAKFLPNADGPIRITARSHLGPRASLTLVEVGSTTLLLAMTGSGIQTLHVWSEPASAGAAAPANGRAAAVPGQLRGLQSWLGGRG